MLQVPRPTIRLSSRCHTALFTIALFAFSFVAIGTPCISQADPTMSFLFPPH